MKNEGGMGGAGRGVEAKKGAIEKKRESSVNGTVQ